MSVPQHIGRPRRRAHNGDFASYSPATISEYRAYSDAYESYAKVAGFDSRYPTPQQMQTYLLEDDAGSSRGRHKRFAALGAFFRMHGAPNVMEHPVVLDTMEELRTKSSDPRDLRAGHHRRRSQWYAYESTSENVLKAYARIERRWIAFGDSKGFDPQHPRNDQIIAYLDERAKVLAYRTVRNDANGLRFFFRRNGLPDLIDEEQVLAHLDELRRECKPPKPPAPVYADALIPGLAQLDQDAIIDVRDGLITLLAALGGVVGAHTQGLDRSRIVEVDEGVLFYTDISRRREIFIGRPSKNELDIRPWLRRWLKHVGTDPGPLFPHISPRGKICGKPVTLQTIAAAIERVACLCATGATTFTARQLKKAFLVKVTGKHGPAVAIQSVGYAGASSLDHHAAFLGPTYRRRKLANKHRSRRWSAAPMGRTSLAPRAPTQASGQEGTSDA